MYMTVQELLELDEPWEYDFKRLRYDEFNPVKRFWKYKKTDDNFDCDCCDLAMQIQLRLFGAESYFGRNFEFQGQKLETDTLNSFESRYWQATCEERKSDSFIRFAHLTHTIGNFAVGPAGFNCLKGPYDEAKQTGDWTNFDRFDAFCKKHADMQSWFFEHRYEILMEMYFKNDGSIIPLDNINTVNDLIVERGKKIVAKLKKIVS
mgnify:FL=1